MPLTHKMTEHLLSHSDVEKLLSELEASITRTECRTCECFQGFLAQLEGDCEPAALPLIRLKEVPDDQLHSCLGCDPCPPADVYTRYLIDRQS